MSCKGSASVLEMHDVELRFKGRAWASKCPAGWGG